MLLSKIGVDSTLTMIGGPANKVLFGSTSKAPRNPTALGSVKSIRGASIYCSRPAS